MRNIKQNLFFAFIYNASGVLIAPGVLYPAFGLLLSPLFAALAMSASSTEQPVVGGSVGSSHRNVIERTTRGWCSSRGAEIFAAALTLDGITDAAKRENVGRCTIG